MDKMLNNLISTGTNLSEIRPEEKRIELEEAMTPVLSVKKLEF